MSLDIRPVQPQQHPDFAAEVRDIDLGGPLSDDDIAEINGAIEKYAVLVFHDQTLSGDQHVAFTERLGPLQPNVNTKLFKVEDRRLDLNFSDVSNLDKHANIRALDDRNRLFALGNRLWHSDASFREVPAKYSLLYGVVVPPQGGNTEFADMRRAYETLDDETKTAIEDLICEHSNMYSREKIGFTDFTDEDRARFKPVLQRLVRHHPDMGGKKSLFLSAHGGGIVGWPRPEAVCFLRDLTEHATQREFVYAHEWKQGDLVIWDNRQTMHRGRPYDDQNCVREMRRTTIVGDGPTVAQQAA